MAAPALHMATRLALVGGFTPRRCGIATFTADTYTSLKLASPAMAIDVYAMTSDTERTVFDPIVHKTIEENDQADYISAARAINKSGADVVWVQHEFGLFGGPAGDMILELTDRIAAPVIVTLHTILPSPDDDQMRVMHRLISRASKLIVMSKLSRDLLISKYGADRDQVVLIEHGVPDRPFGRTREYKAKFGFTGQNILMTFGLLSPGKGIEGVILALPAIVEDHPDTLYCIVGATHPNLVSTQGEQYRNGLKALAVSLGVDRHIQWIDEFLETHDLLNLIEAADIYVTPYLGVNQSTSGTLCYAVALGKAVVSTPYVHAAELLADGNGVIVPFNDSAAIARQINVLLSNPIRLLALQKRAYSRGRAMIWPAFAERCLDLILATKINSLAAPAFTPVGITGLLRICDSTGILQHSIHSVPDRAHGYCVDDNARALMLMNRLGDEAQPHKGQLAATFAAFVQSAWNADAGAFRNFMDYGRNWLEDSGSQDSCGRTIWALGATAYEGQTESLRYWARGLFNQTASTAFRFGSPRAIAFAMLGASYMLAADPNHPAARRILQDGAERLFAMMTRVRRPDWVWFEIMLAYDNARIPEAMIRAGEYLGHTDYTQCGIDTLRWINGHQIAPQGHFRPVGSGSFGHHHHAPAPFDQQPVEIWAAIDAASAAYDATRDAAWLDKASCAYNWFSGANDRGVVVADPVTGTCRDGINSRGLNLNEGAESVLAYQLANCAMRDFLIKLE